MCPYFYYLMFKENLYRNPQSFFPPFEPPTQSGAQHNMQDGPPKGSPPSQIPIKSQGSLKSVDPGSIRFCRYKYTYIWLNNGRGFWVWITFVGRNSISGWRWTGRNWVYFGIDTRRIESFVCY